MRLQAEGAPDAADARGRDAAVTRHAAGAPVRGAARLALQRLHDDALDLGVIDLARHAGARLIEQPVDTALEKAPAPLADGLRGHRSRAATALLLRPEAHPKTIRARNAKPCAVFRRCV